MSDNSLTVINVFTVEPARQQPVVELLIRATDESVRHARGMYEVVQVFFLHMLRPGPSIERTVHVKRQASSGLR